MSSATLIAPGRREKQIALNPEVPQTVAQFLAAAEVTVGKDFTVTVINSENVAANVTSSMSEVTVKPGDEVAVTSQNEAG